ncbi:MAG: hypothetical protein ACRED8_00530 [Caulobacteraceae bacterium]
MFAAFPLTALPVAAYNLLALTLLGGFSAASAASKLAAPIFSLRNRAGGDWPINLSDILLVAALILFFVELLKAIATRRAAIVNHGLSIALFILCLVEMLLASAFATSTFFLISLMVLLDVLAGFVATIVDEREAPPERY